MRIDREAVKGWVADWKFGMTAAFVVFLGAGISMMIGMAIAMAVGLQNMEEVRFWGIAFAVFWAPPAIAKGLRRD
ncbi:MAG: hypothetical protein Q8J89_09510 [Caulobacter sp.]|nr:hypothetical protein [Caulobacter sp.]